MSQWTLPKRKIGSFLFLIINIFQGLKFWESALPFGDFDPQIPEIWGFLKVDGDFLIGLGIRANLGKIWGFLTVNPENINLPKMPESMKRDAFSTAKTGRRVV